MTATERLRALLDEAGVEWKAWDGVHPITVWHDETYLYEFVEYRLVNDAKQVSDCPNDNGGHCELTIKVYNCTPEQAIAATLGDADETSARQGDADLAAENAKLRELEKSRRWIARMLGEQTARVVNLQELMQDMFDGMCDHDRCDICPHWQEGYNGCEYHERMAQLGIEVDE